jgi:hypothetical protein
MTLDSLLNGSSSDGGSTSSDEDGALDAVGAALAAAEGSDADAFDDLASLLDSM